MLPSGVSWRIGPAVCAKPHKPILSRHDPRAILANFVQKDHHFNRKVQAKVPTNINHQQIYKRPRLIFVRLSTLRTSLTDSQRLRCTPSCARQAHSALKKNTEANHSNSIALSAELRRAGCLSHLFHTDSSNGPFIARSPPSVK